MTTTSSAIARIPARLSGPELRAWRAHWHVSQAQLAAWAGIHVNTIIRWESGEREIPVYLRPALERLESDLAAELRLRAQGLPAGR